mgnify:CR=1 FL=1
MRKVFIFGSYIIAKVVGCGAFDQNIAYPDGVVLTLKDEIKILQPDEQSLHCVTTKNVSHS